MSRYVRRDQRIALAGGVRLVWQDTAGREQFLQGRCLDVSHSGVRLELPRPIPVRTYVTLRTDTVGVAVNAAVRHCAPLGGKYVVGLEFTVPLRMADPRAAEILNLWLAQSSASGNPPA